MAAAVEGDHIAAGEQLVQRHIFDTAVRRRKAVIGNDLHAKPLANIDEDPADFAGADHAHGFPVKIKARQPIQGKVEFPRTVVGFMDTPHGGQQQGDSMLGNSIWRISRDMHHVDFSERGLHVHVVVSG